MNQVILEAAEQEAQDAIQYYERQREGLGEEFAEELRAAIRRIQSFPGAWTPLPENYRRCRLNRFPYGVVYRVEGDDLIIVAVMLLRRKPGYWKDRL